MSGFSPGARDINATEGERWAQERERLLATRISDLGLRIEGTPLEPLVERLYAELDAVGIRFKPVVYLADEWACPDGVPLIGVPFWPIRGSCASKTR
jgi:hypothetical protein